MNKARVALHLPASPKAAAEDIARRDRVSLNQFISTAVAREMGAVEAEEAAGILRRRGAAGGRERALEFLQAAPELPPGKGDERIA